MSRGVHGSGCGDFFYLTHHGGLKKIQPNPTYHIRESVLHGTVTVLFNEMNKILNQIKKI